MNSYQLSLVCEFDAKDCECIAHNGFLTRRGYELAKERGVDKAEEISYLDSTVSVSALPEPNQTCVWDDELLDSQYRRFLNEVAV